MRGHPHIHERFIRHIWSRQYLTHSSLKTIDGDPVRVLTAGTLNHDSGPDILQAKVQIGRTVFVGDVEIHRNAVDWFAHQHQEDPRYNKVILHVVLEDGGSFDPTVVRSGRTVPVLVLSRYLNDSLRTIWQKTILDERARASSSLACSGKNDVVDVALLSAWLTKLSVERAELKLRRYEERLRELAREHQSVVRESPRTWGEPSREGEQDEIPPAKEPTLRELSRKSLWEQVLYEALFDALGFSKNREPFVALARSLTLERFRALTLIIPELSTENGVEALFFGVAGLIPSWRTLQEKESRRHVRLLSKEWKVIRKQYRGTILHAADWQFFPTRPINFPTVRLAAGIELVKKLIDEDLFRAVIQLIKSDIPPNEKERRFEALFGVSVSLFWQSRYSFDERSERTFRTIGRSRIFEMIVNAILPLALLYARIFKDKGVREGAIELYETLPPAETNSMTRLMENQLLKRRIDLDSVAHQQAVIQLYKFYCLAGRCGECEIGKAIVSR